MGCLNRAKFPRLPFSILFAALILSPSVRAQIDPSGEWTPPIQEDAIDRSQGPEIGDYLGIPLNDAGRLRSDTWDAAILEMPENQCVPHSSDFEWRGPFALRIWKEVDRVTQELIAFHTHIGAYGNEMTIWMDNRPSPPDYASKTWQGFSKGHWEGNTLAVFTDHLKENEHSLTGIPRSSLGTVSTHIMRHENYLTVAVIVYDPAYLTEPYIRSTDYVLNLQQMIPPYPCTPDEEVNRPEGVVPNHLPGANSFLTEFPARHGVPPEAARGGAETMYPEYQIKLKTMKVLPRLPAKPPDR
jgi:hypothetical protein